MGKRYGQFCPVAMAAEVLSERWVPLVLRELMYGSSRFNDIARGVPLMSRALLATRLRELARAGIVRKDQEGYRLTDSGEALRTIVEEMGMWAQRWRTGALADDDLDDKLLMWSLRRSLRLPPDMDRRLLLRFDFHGLPRSARVARRTWWLLAQQGEVEICVKDPGHEVDILVAADLRAFTEVLLGRRPLAAAQREGCVKLHGPAALLRQLRHWLPLNGEARETLNIVQAH